MKVPISNMRAVKTQVTTLSICTVRGVASLKFKLGYARVEQAECIQQRNIYQSRKTRRLISVYAVCQDKHTLGNGRYM